MIKPRNYFPHQTKHGYAPSFIEDGRLNIEGYPGTLPSLDACTTECTRRNREQIDFARQQLAEAQAHMDAVLAVFEIGPSRSNAA